MRSGMQVVVLLLAVLILPTPAGAQVAQASIAGVVKDTSGSVLPGVTVEASSPALIEKARTVLTDGAGQYRIEQLRPGTYTMTFTLAGFNAVKREGIELTGSFAATVSPELRVGAVEETVVVTGASPIVDVQSAAKQRVIDNEVLLNIPTGRTPLTAATLIPGMNLNNQDVGGTNIIATTGGNMTIHGSNGNDQRVMIDGLSTANAEGAGQASNFLPNMGAAEEVAVDFSSGTADQATGGVRINIIPREGGNTIKGSVFATAANSAWQTSNYTQDLIDRGLITPNALKFASDVNPGIGGPIRPDKLWFYLSGRWVHTQNFVGNSFNNANAYTVPVYSPAGVLLNPEAYVYLTDRTNQSDSNRGISNATQQSKNLRLTWQATTRNKLSFFLDDQARCQCGLVSSTMAPESAVQISYPIQRMATVGWTAPVTNRLLIEARGGFRGERYKYNPFPEDSPVLNLIPVTENGGPVPGISYHGHPAGNFSTQPFQNTYGRNFDLVASASYVTGTHAIKFGVLDTIVIRDEQVDDNNFNMSYVFNSGPLLAGQTFVTPVPSSFAIRATPFEKKQRQRAGLGLYVQDRWTVDRLTTNVGVRYDYLNMYAPANHFGPAPLIPTRNFDLPAKQLVNWHDVTPRLGAAYDLFGKGKTGLRVGLNKYVVSQGVQGPYGTGIAPDALIATGVSPAVTRTWTDNNGNFRPDCAVTEPLAQGPAVSGTGRLGGSLTTVDTCGALSNANFGNATLGTIVNPDLLQGFGVRPYNWEFSAGIQQEVAPRVSVDFGYFRRWFGNFVVTDNRTLAPGVSLSDFGPDFGSFSVTAPLDPRLPGGGGYTIGPIVNINPNRVGLQSDNYFTFASDYGNQIQRWNGVDLSINARLRQGVLLQGGVSTGRQVTDNCEILAQVPESSGAIVASGLPYCHQEQNFQTQIKFLGVYTIPKVDVALSGSFQSIPGPQISANVVYNGAEITPLLGRSLAGANTVTVNQIAPGTLTGDRLNQLDIRLAKILRYQRTRTSVNFDVYNLFNQSTVLAENATFTRAAGTTPARWRVPTSIITARFAKFSVQFDF